MSDLRSEITEGWKVKIVDHDYGAGGRDDVTVTKVTAEGLTLTARRPWSSQGRSFRTMDFTWAGDREIDGRTVRLYRTATGTTSRSYKGERRLVKTFEFAPPR